MTKVAYEDNWRPLQPQIYPTGICKSTKGGPHEDREYLQVRVKLFGIPLWCRWVNKDYVKYYDEVKETIYKCEYNDADV